MLSAHIVPLLITTDLPAQAELTEFGELLAGAVRALPAGGGTTFPGHLHGGVFWLGRPAPPGAPPPAAEELRFAALLGFLSAAGPGLTAREVAAAARAAIVPAVTARYGDLGGPPAVITIRADDVRERTPDDAIRVATPPPEAQEQPTAAITV
ncbi:hypothetical protein C1I98_23340 [Spongiactinospora gelatinilytica]|uniref:Uncharacterized protein n=1 Tax=Spongiactinospora gelatinilytica TaxID=2666298 RepID=A0A2W2GQQ2_9ACTN|nr:hypothetical protein [Spongiactinospora gelatinilytica]PZG39720.1 hypothetical protein C1I98_23340 [Spongiactinospora gelatinilytica]